MCDLGKTNVILGIPQLQAHNPEINWEMGKVEITRCLLLCRRNMKLKRKEKSKESKKSNNNRKREDCEMGSRQQRELEIKVDYRKIEEIILQKFLKWKKVFGKVESKRCLQEKFGIILQISKKCSNPRKEESILYPKMKEKRVQNFMEDQLRKGYIRLSKSPQTSPVFFVNKKDRSKRIVMDYHSLNK